MRADADQRGEWLLDSLSHAHPPSRGRPGADAFEDGAERDAPVHIRIQMRNGRKSITSVTGLADDLDLKKILKAFKRNFKCNGAIIQVRHWSAAPQPGLSPPTDPDAVPRGPTRQDKELGLVIQLQGDQRAQVCDFLTDQEIVQKDAIIVHGF